MMNRKKMSYALVAILFWAVPFGLIGWQFEAGFKWTMIGLVIGGLFALIGELANNWIGRSLPLALLLGVALGFVVIWLIFGPAYIDYTINFEPALGSPPPGQNGPSFPNIIGMLEWTFYTGAMVLASAAGAVIGGFVGLGSGLIGSLILRVRRGYVNMNKRLAHAD